MSLTSLKDLLGTPPKPPVREPTRIKAVWVPRIPTSLFERVSYGERSGLWGPCLVCGVGASGTALCPDCSKFINAWMYGMGKERAISPRIRRRLVSSTMAVIRNITWLNSHFSKHPETAELICPGK